MTIKLGKGFVGRTENGKVKIVKSKKHLPVNKQIAARKKQRVASPSQAQFLKESSPRQER